MCVSAEQERRSHAKANRWQYHEQRGRHETWDVQLCFLTTCSSHSLRLTWLQRCEGGLLALTAVEGVADGALPE